LSVHVQVQTKQGKDRDVASADGSEGATVRDNSPLAGVKEA